MVWQYTAIEPKPLTWCLWLKRNGLFPRYAHLRDIRRPVVRSRRAAKRDGPSDGAEEAHACKSVRIGKETPAS